MEKKIQEAFFVWSVQYETVPALRQLSGIEKGTSQEPGKFGSLFD